MTDDHIQVEIEFKGLRHTASGNPQSVISEVLFFISKVAPAYDLASKIVYTPDVASLIDKLASFGKLTVNGDLILERTDLPAEKAILIVLALAQLANSLGKSSNSDVDTAKLAKSVGKAEKTIQNMLAQLQKFGLVERSQRGNYHITMLGLNEVEKFIGSQVVRSGGTTGT